MNKGPMKKGQHVHPVGAAMEWVARIVAAGLMMVLPGLGGNWVDRQVGTHFVALAGFALGIASSLVYLLAITRGTASTTQTTTHPTNGLEKKGALANKGLLKEPHQDKQNQEHSGKRH